MQTIPQARFQYLSNVSRKSVEADMLAQSIASISWSVSLRKRGKSRADEASDYCNC